MNSMIERIHLEILREVDRHGSLTAAADVLCLTQSALSHSIKKLESRCGAALWRKEGRRLQLTQAGEYLLLVANRVLPQLEHAQVRMLQYAQGLRGTLRIGMECHPCHQWLTRIVAAFLRDWPDVDVDVRQKFQFGGVGALFGYEIDLLLTPDPLHKPGLAYKSVFSYEQVLVVSSSHRLAGQRYIEPADLATETLISYPVDPDRLDVYNQFLTPAGFSPRQHKIVETTEILLQLVAADRGVAAMPDWLIHHSAGDLPLRTVRLGKSGIDKRLYLGMRQADAASTEYLQAFVEMAAAEGDPQRPGISRPVSSQSVSSG